MQAKYFRQKYKINKRNEIIFVLFIKILNLQKKDNYYDNK